MHPEAYNWIKAQATTLRKLDCVDLGGRNVNGSIRELFDPASWTAVDIADGPGVDVVANVTNWQPDREWDLVCSTELLEHVAVPSWVIDTMYRCCRPGGVILITAAAPPRAPHSSTGASVVPQGEHYRNIEPEVLQAWVRPLVSSIDEIVHDARHGDVYLRATK